MIRDGFFNLRFSIILLTRIQSVAASGTHSALAPQPLPCAPRWSPTGGMSAEHVEAGRSLELWAQLSQASKVCRGAEVPRAGSRVTEIVEATSRACGGRQVAR